MRMTMKRNPDKEVFCLDSFPRWCSDTYADDDTSDEGADTAVAEADNAFFLLSKLMLKIQSICWW